VERITPTMDRRQEAKNALNFFRCTIDAEDQKETPYSALARITDLKVVNREEG